MSDRTPADVIASDRAARRVRSQPDALDRAIARNILAALDGAGFRVVPIPDDNTRALAARLRDFPSFAFRYEDTVYEETEHGDQREQYLADLRAAAAYLDGQPQDRPDRCPNPECDEGVSRPSGNCGFDDDGAMLEIPCPDAWHVGGSGDTR